MGEQIQKQINGGTNYKTVAKQYKKQSCKRITSKRQKMKYEKKEKEKEKCFIA